MNKRKRGYVRASTLPAPLRVEKANYGWVDTKADRAGERGAGKPRKCWPCSLVPEASHRQAPPAKHDDGSGSVVRLPFYSVPRFHRPPPPLSPATGTRSALPFFTSWSFFFYRAKQGAVGRDGWKWLVSLGSPPKKVHLP
jgi:hypothetical protein